MKFQFIRLKLSWLLAIVFLVNQGAECKLPGSEGGLILRVTPAKSAFALGSEIILRFTLKNVSKNRRILAIRGASLHDLIYLEVVDKDGKRIPWRGKIPSREYPPGFFVVLKPGQSSSFNAPIFEPPAVGYVIQKPGVYRVRAEFSLAPKNYFASVADGADIPERPVRSNWTEFVVLTTRHAGDGGPH